MHKLILFITLLIAPSFALAEWKAHPATICQFWPSENANQRVNGEQVKGTGRKAMAVSQFGHITNKNTSDLKVLGLVCPLVREELNRDLAGVYVHGFTDDCHSQSDEEVPDAVCHSNSRAASTCIVRSRTPLGVVRQTSTKTFRRVDENTQGRSSNMGVGWSGPELEVLSRQAAAFVFCELGRNMRLDGVTSRED